MDTDISFYINGTVEQRLNDLITIDSPLSVHERKDDNNYILRSIDSTKILLYYSPLEYKTIEKSRMHQDIIKKLGFKPHSVLSYRDYTAQNREIGFLVRLLNYLNYGTSYYYLVGSKQKSKEVFMCGIDIGDNLTVSKRFFELAKK